MNEQYDMVAFDAMVARSKADLTSHYRRNVHDGMLHGWIEGVKNERGKCGAEIERLRDLLAKSIRREEIIEAENDRLKRAIKSACFRIESGNPMPEWDDVYQMLIPAIYQVKGEK